MKTFVAELIQELPAAPEDVEFATSSFIKAKKLSTIVKNCGSDIVSGSLLRELEKAFAEAGIHTHRPLTSAALSRHDWVRLSRLPFAPEELFFVNESLLREYLLAGIGHFGPLRDLDLETTEFRLSSRGRIDVLCRERRRDNRGPLVAIELKKSNEGAGVVNQLVRYLRELKDHPLAKGGQVRGIIISGRADDVEARQLAQEREFRIDWYCYTVSLQKAASSALADPGRPR